MATQWRPNGGHPFPGTKERLRNYKKERKQRENQLRRQNFPKKQKSNKYKIKLARKGKKYEINKRRNGGLSRFRGWRGGATTLVRR